MNLNLFVLVMFLIFDKSTANPGSLEKGSFLETEVVIIGGGASGIAAAQVLHDANIEFLLLEADEKIGKEAEERIIRNHYLIF